MIYNDFNTKIAITEEIKSRLDLVEIIGEDIALEQQGRDWVGHDTRHDSQSGKSLHVTPDAGVGGLYHCFNCGEGGDVFSWLMNFRGMTFPETLRYLANRAGVPLPEMSPEEQARQQQLYDDRKALTPVMAVAAEIYHNQLTEEHYATAMTRWGITAETCQKFKIGYAPPGGRLLVERLGILFGQDLLIKSGLFWLNDNGTLSEVFRGRLMFPYWHNNHVVYFIGRWYPGCPDDEKAKKYRKQLVHRADREYVSPAIDNSYFYGEDSARGAREILITEGVADCIAALQAGFNCISPVTTSFRDKDFPRMARLVKRAQKVYICNDNEDNHAGEKGALKTAEYLERLGTPVGIVTLPRPEGISKIDVAEFLRDSGEAGPTALLELMAQARSLWEVKAENLIAPANRVEAMRTVKAFVEKELAGCDPMVAKAIIKDTLKPKFGLDADDVKRLTKAAKDAPGDDGAGDDPEDKKSQADILVSMALRNVELFHDDEQAAFGRVQVDGHLETWPLNSRRFKEWLRHLYYEAYGRGINKDAVGQASDTLTSLAIFKGLEYRLHLRVAEHGGAFWYDLCNKEWQAVKITPGKWELVSNPPILFRRFNNQAAQVLPLQWDSDINCIDGFLSLSGDLLFLFKICLVAALVPGIPKVILAIFGPQGAAKSTHSEIYRALIDPSVLTRMIMPDNIKDLTLHFYRNYVIPYDNLNHLTKMQSDALCMASTGGAFPKRELYADIDEVFLRFKRVPVLNGVNLVAVRPDILDRAVLIELERIAKDKRRPEKEFKAEFEEARPAIFTGMLDILAWAMEIHLNANLPNLTRMADFCKWGYAIGEAMEKDGGERFLKAYQQNQGIANDEAIKGHPVASAVMLLMSERTDPWTGKAADLLSALNLISGTETWAKSWPKSANSLTKKLNEVKPNLEAEGIMFSVHHTKGGNVITIEKILNKGAYPSDTDTLYIQEQDYDFLK